MTDKEKDIRRLISIKKQEIKCWNGLSTFRPLTTAEQNKLMSVKEELINLEKIQL